ncbi:hypothetical protein COOONC_04084 [Cooperia oncophora]
MSFEFKIPSSFLKKKAEQEQTSDGDGRSTESSSLFKRQFPSSRLFGNLTRGGPTSVVSQARSEGSKYNESRTDGGGGSVSRFKLVRNVEKSPKQPGRPGNSATGSGGDRLRPSSIFRKRSSGSIASAAAVKRATKLVRAKRSTSREDISSSDTSDSWLPIQNFSQQLLPNRSLLALIGKHCPTEFDRYQVLEERDKLLSKLRDEENKHIDEKSRKVQGLCTGMCTEKERYVRVVQKRISPYECGPNGLEPNRLVKEYARSTWILHTRSDDDLAMWYDFLWSRTRAIRKEITQLMLSDATAVALFERSVGNHAIIYRAPIIKL